MAGIGAKLLIGAYHSQSIDIWAALIAGSVVALILVGMPLLWPYAWLAFASMCGAIYLAIRLARPTAR